MDFDSEIICIDKEGNENRFRYSVEESYEYDEEDEYKMWIFRIVPSSLVYEDWFEFSVTQVSMTTGKITMMANHNIKDYAGKGIPDKMIEEASAILNIGISSSSNKQASKSFENESRTPDADKVWQRMVKKSKAVYDDGNDVYLFQN